MVKRKYRRAQYTVKQVIDALKEGAKTWSDLEELKPVISGSTLDRNLKKLEYWGLVKKEEGYWNWSEYTTFNSEQELNLKLEHSQKLIPAFENIINLSFEIQDSLFVAAKEHLRTSYPSIHQKLTELLEMMNEKKHEKLLKKYSDEITNLHSGYPNHEYHPFQVLVFLSWNPMPNHIEARDRMVRGVKPLLENYRGLSENLSILKLEIEHGTPLRGHCMVCPRVKVQEENKNTLL